MQDAMSSSGRHYLAGVVIVLYLKPSAQRQVTGFSPLRITRTAGPGVGKKSGNYDTDDPLFTVVFLA